jgi:hypothetical protein
MNVEVRGPYHKGGESWDVLVDGEALPGYVLLVDGQYRVNLGGMRGMPLPLFATVEEAVQALVDYHVSGRR